MSGICCVYSTLCLVYVVFALSWVIVACVVECTGSKVHEERRGGKRIDQIASHVVD